MGRKHRHSEVTETTVIHHLNVRGLAGLHLGKRVTVMTRHTEATGVIQWLLYEADVINFGNPMRDKWASGRTATVITPMPNQDIITEMGDDVPVNG